MVDHSGRMISSICSASLTAERSLAGQKVQIWVAQKYACSCPVTHWLELVADLRGAR